MRSKNIRLILIILICFSILCNINIKEGNQIKANPDPVFYISILGPNTNPARNQWMTLIVEELPKIGIGIDVFDHTSWSSIYPRVFDYPGPYPVPSYSEGGYDVLFMGWNFGFDFDPNPLFHSDEMIPLGNNFYQYNNQDMDESIDNYINSITRTNRINYAKDIQGILYDDLPSIPIINTVELYPHNSSLIGWDPLLWLLDYQSMENWSIPDQTEFHYAVPATFSTFSLYHAESAFDEMWLNQIYDSLIERDPLSNRFHDEKLALSYSTLDGLNYSIQINPEAKWADGYTLNASDVKFSYDLLINPSFGCTDYAYWNNYLHTNSVVIKSEFEVEINFNQQYVFQENNLALELLPKHIWESVPVDQFAAQALTWATTDPTKLIGAGPYYLYNYDSVNDIIHLKRNDYYDDWSDVVPHFEEIYFEFYSTKEGALNSLSSGSIDMVDGSFYTLIDEVPLEAGYTIVRDPGYQEMAINMEHPIIGTGEQCPIPGEQSANYIRKAITLTFPRELIVEEIMNELAFPAVIPWPSLAVDFDENLEAYEYNLTKAKEYMVLAGYDVYVDSDGDGVSNYDELYVYGSDPYNTDSDGDGIEDGEEVILGLDGYITNPANPDTDADGLTDDEELIEGLDGYLTDPTNNDTDTDGLIDGLEMIESTNPLDNDTDDDFTPDGWEVANSLDPLTNDSYLDPDGDGLTNLEEFNYNTDPNNIDTDDDGYTDKEEIDKGTDPLNPDSYPKRLGFALTYVIVCSFCAFLVILFIKKRK